MATLLIDIRDVTGHPVLGDTVALTAPAPRPSSTGGVTRPFDRLVLLDNDGRATVQVDPGPLRVTFHDAYDREVVIDTRVPAEGGTFTLRELIVSEIGNVDDVPGIREALDGKADVEHEHRIDDIVDLDEALADKAPMAHDHVAADITDLAPVLAGKADVNHRHTINEVDDLTWSLDQKVNVTDLRESVNEFSSVYLARIVDGAPESLDTLREVAAEFERQDDAIEAVFTALGNRAMKSHTHSIGDVTGLHTALGGKAAKSHSHGIDDVEGLDDALSAIAGPTASVTISGSRGAFTKVASPGARTWVVWSSDGRALVPQGLYRITTNGSGVQVRKRNGSIVTMNSAELIQTEDGDAIMPGSSSDVLMLIEKIPSEEAP